MGREKEKISSYEDLVVWQKSKNFVLSIYRKTEKFPKNEQFGLTSQLRRAAVSVPSNIVPIFTNLKNWMKIEDPRFCNQVKNLNKIGAEGFRRGTKKEQRQFLRIAYGSGAEIETQLIIANELGYIKSGNYSKLRESQDEIMKILNTLIRQFKDQQ